MKFKNLIGTYQAPNPDGQPIVYPQGSVFESNIDLAKRFNDRRAIKFKRMPDDSEVHVAEVGKSRLDEVDDSPSEPDDVFSSMTLAELREEAREHDIDVSGARTKRDVLKIIRGASTGLAGE
jgi:hypothetical protein